MKDGHYWMKAKYCDDPMICFVEGDDIWTIGSEIPFEKEYIAEIGDYIETPDKYKE